MRLSNERISIKLVRPYELGWSKDTHATQVHLPEDYIENWKEEVVLNGYLVIQDYGIERISAYSTPTNKTNGKPLRSPWLRKSPFKNNKGKYPSAWERIEKAGNLIRKRYDKDQIALITCRNTEKENNFIIILCRLDDFVLRVLKNEIDLKINKVISKVIYKEDKSYKNLKNLAERMCELIQIRLNEDYDDSFFDIENLEDAKKKIEKLVTYRQGQPKFRSGLMRNYDSKCCITGCEVLDVLEACHIYPYMGPKTNHLSNGFILRSDLHMLYDKGLLCIDENYKVKISGRWRNDPMYNIYHGKIIRLPYENLPNKQALKFKLMDFKN